MAQLLRSVTVALLRRQMLQFAAMQLLCAISARWRYMVAHFQIESEDTCNYITLFIVQNKGNILIFFHFFLFSAKTASLKLVQYY